MPPGSGTEAYAAVNTLNQYTTITPAGGSATGLTYDARGNLTSDGTRGYIYDAANRLRAVTQGAPVKQSNVYDPLDRRTIKVMPGIGTTYFISAGAEEIAEYDTAFAVKARYIPGPGTDEPIAMVACSGVGCATAVKSFFHEDKTGSVIAMSDVNGNMVEGPYNYDGYGNGPAATGVPYKFTGRRLDGETGLYYYRARFYAPTLGRFLQTDPIGYQDGINWYAYVANDPVNAADPSGQCCYESLDPNTDPTSQRGAAQAQFAQAHPRAAAAMAAGSALVMVAPALVLFAPEITMSAPEWMPAAADLLAGESLGGTSLLAGGAAAGTKIANELSTVRAAEEGATTITLSRAKYPEAAAHVERAQAAGHPNTLTVNRANAAANRRESLRGTKPRAGVDRDEYPPAMFEEGGGGSFRRVHKPVAKPRCRC